METSGGFLQGEESKAPKPEIEFGIARDVVHGWHIHTDVYPAKTLIASEPSMEYWNKLTAQLLAQYQSEAGMQGLFVSPFYAMAAWKTYEGTFLSPTSPVKLIPNSEIPVVTTDGDINSREIDFKIAAAAGRLYYRMQTPEILREWVGKIESLVIFTSYPLQKYEIYESLLPMKHVFTENYCVALDLQTGETKNERICTEILPTAWKAPHQFFKSSINGTGLNDKLKFYPIAELPLSAMAPTDEVKWTPAPSASYINEEVLEGVTTYDEIINSGKAPAQSSEIIIEGTGKEIFIETRPIKLGDAGKLKQVSTLFFRGNYLPGNIALTVYGSRDMLKWLCIAKRKGGTAVALPKSSFRFYKVEIRGYLGEGESLEGISIK